MNKYDKQHINNVRRYQRKIDKIYKTAAEEIAQRAAGLPAPDDDIFSLEDHPRTMEAINALMDDMRKQISFTVTDGVKAEWDLSNAKNDDMVDDALAGRAKAAETVRWYRTNIEARDAFLTRVENGMRLSDRVWNYTNQFKQEIELGLDCGIRDGLDAPAMARQLKQYLKYPDKLFRRVRDEHGILRLSKRAAAFHPGRGVYRSSYKNARRLAATETNMAYRQADYDRWQQLEMVVGVEIRMSNNHTCLNNKGKAVAFYDICDELKGKYPKDFKFVGWHPHCRCIVTPIKKSREEIDADIDRLLDGQPALPSEASENYVKDMPEGWDNWMDKNQERLERAKSMPYFIRDNFKDGDPTKELRWIGKEPRWVDDGKAGEKIMSYVQNQLGKASDNQFVEQYRSQIEQFMTEAVDESDVAIRMKEDALSQLIEDGRYKNAYETGTNSIVKGDWEKYLAERREAEKALFGTDGHTIYGYLDSKEIGAAPKNKQLASYGGCVVRLKKDALKSATWTPDDSLAMWRSKDVVFRPKSGEFVKGYYHPSDIHKADARMFAESRKARMFKDLPWEDPKVKARQFFEEHGGLYPEVQIHEAVTLDKIDSVTLPFSLKGPKHAEWTEKAKKLRENGVKVYYKQGDKFVEFQDRQLTPAEIRHAARTPEYEKAIREARSKELEEIKWIQRGAENMLKVAAGYGESDVAALQKAMQLGEMNAVKKQTKALAQQLLDIRAQEKALADLIPDVHMWHQQFTMAELKKAHSAVLDKLTDIAPWSLEAQKKALEKEIKYVADPTFMKPHSLHPTWKVAQDAYARQLSDVVYKIETKKINTELAPIEKWLVDHPKASKVASLVQDVKDAIAAGEDLTSINNKMLIAKLDYKKRLAAQAYRDRQKLKSATGGPIQLQNVTRAEANRLIKEFEQEYGDSADDMLRKMTEADWKRFAKEHKIVLTKYTQTYSYLNEPMREIRYCAGRTKDEFDHDMPLLTEALSMQKAPKNMVVRRGVSDYQIKALNKYLSDLQPGDEFVDGGFLSTAVRVDKGFFEEYNLVIVVPKGAQGVYAEPFTHYNGGSFNYTGELWNGTSKESFGCEREWIGQRGSKFKVLKKSGDTIYLQMIGQLYDQTTDYGLYIR